MRRSRTLGYLGGGHAPDPPVNAKDTLFSTQIGKVLDLISEGPIAGLVTGDARSVLLDGTPILPASFDPDLPPDDPVNTPNFQNIRVAVRLGTPDQTPIPEFPDVETVVACGLQAKKPKDRTGEPIVFTSTTPDLDAVIMNLRVGLMFRTSPAVTGGNKVVFKVFLSVNGGPYANVKQPPPPFWSTLPTDGSWWTPGLVKNNYGIPIFSFPPDPGADPIDTNDFFVIQGKTLKGYGKSIRLELPPGTSQYSLRIEKLNDDPSDTTVAGNSLFLDSVAEVIDAKFSYPHRALVAIQVNAETFGAIPTRTYHMRGIIIGVPSNRDNDPDSPTYRQYTGDWDGTFVQSWTDNPAWLTYETLINKRWGLGQFFPEENLDRWILYRIGKTCDEMVPNGFGGTEPRFTCNAYIQSQADAFDFVMQMTSVFRGMAYWSAGLITFTQDLPTTVVHQFTNANVVDGQFTYTGSSRRARHTIALVRYNNKNDLHRPAVEYVADEDGINRYGPNQIEVTGFGCDSQGQARRVGRAVLLSEIRETEMISFQTGLEGALIRPGQLMEVIDSKKGGKRYAGRLRNRDLNVVELDAEVELTTPLPWQIHVQQPARTEIITAPANTTTLSLSQLPASLDPVQIRVHADMDHDNEFDPTSGNDPLVQIVSINLTTRVLTIIAPGVDATPTKFRVDYVVAFEIVDLSLGPGKYTKLPLANPLGSLPPPDGVWLLVSPNVTPKKYRNTSLREIEGGKFEVLGLQYDETKYADIENDDPLSEADHVFRPTEFSIGPPRSLSAHFTTVSTPHGNTTSLDVAWLPSIGQNTIGYDLRYRKDFGSWIRTPRITATEYSIQNALPGVYQIEVRGVGVGKISGAATLEIVTDGSAPVGAMRVTGLSIQGRGNSDEFTGRDCRFAWRTNVTDIDAPFGDELFGADTTPFPQWFAGFRVEIWDKGGPNGAWRKRRVENGIWDEFYSYTHEKNQEDSVLLNETLAQRDFYAFVRGLDTFGNQGSETQKHAFNRAEPPPLMTFVPSATGTQAFYTPPVDPDNRGIVVYGSLTDPDVEPVESNEIYRGSSNPALIPIPVDSTLHMRWGFFDAFEDNPTEVSGVDSQTVGSITRLDFWDQADHGGLKSLHASGAGSPGNWDNTSGLSILGSFVFKDFPVLVPAGKQLRVSMGINLIAGASFPNNTTKQYNLSLWSALTAGGAAVGSLISSVVSVGKSSGDNQDQTIHKVRVFPATPPVVDTTLYFSASIFKQHPAEGGGVLELDYDAGYFDFFLRNA